MSPSACSIEQAYLFRWWGRLRQERFEVLPVHEVPCASRQWKVVWIRLRRLLIEVEVAVDRDMQGVHVSRQDT